MKKIMVMACLCLVALTASAQKNFTAWYGANLASCNADEIDSEMKFLNIGVDYTAPINDIFDWTAGASFQTKGFKEWDPKFIQIDANASWNFFSNDDIKVGVLTGPYVGFCIADDDMEEMNTFGFGWTAGAKATYKDFSLKIGYDFGFTNWVDFDGEDSADRTVYFRLGYSF